MERVTNQVEDLLKTQDQKLMWQYITAKVKEILINGHNMRLVIDVQNHRINSVSPTEFIAGVSQISYQLGKID